MIFSYFHAIRTRNIGITSIIHILAVQCRCGSDSANIIDNEVIKMNVDTKTGLFCPINVPPPFPEDSIVHLVWQVNKALFDHGVPPSTLVPNSKFGLIPMLDYYSSLGQKIYCENVTKQFIIEMRQKYELHEIKEFYWKHSRRMATVLMHYVKSGNIDLSHLPPWGIRQPIPEFKKHLDLFIKDLKTTGVVADSTIRISWSAVRRLLFVFEDTGFTNINQIGYKEFSDCITILSEHLRGGLGKSIYCIKLFLEYLYRTGTTQVDLTRAIPQFPKYRKNSVEGFTNEEILQIFAAIDTTTPIGKRDYAAFVLASQTSLRAVDIAKIKRSDIDWHKNEIRVIQAKTTQAITYPLLPESGNAIADYILHGRPVGAEPYVFISHQGLPRQISANVLITRLRIYLKKAEISSEKSRRAFQSFRRTVATNLLDNEVSLEMMQQITGHRDFSSVKPYLSINEKGLKQCSISFPKREVF